VKRKSASWQSRLDRALLDVDLKPQARFRNIQRALQDPALVADVQSAIAAVREKGFGAGHPEAIETLWPEGTTARRDIEAIVSLRDQIPEAVEELQAALNKSRAAGASEPSRSSMPEIEIDPTTVLTSLSSLVTDEEKQKELEEELKNVFRSTPTGLETPKYEVVGSVEGPVVLGRPEQIDLRQYETFSIARTVMDSPTSQGEGFNTLAGYLFGGNVSNQSMAMTMPVETSSGGEGQPSTMSFVLPAANADAPPEPNSSDVQIAQVPARLAAVKTFPGIATAAEVERQRLSVLAALAADGRYVPAGGEEEVSVLQYNPPYTIPWRRRNELAVVVKLKEVVSEAEAAVETLENSVAEPSEVQMSKAVAVDEEAATLAVDEVDAARTEDGEIEGSEDVDVDEKNV